MSPTYKMRAQLSGTRNGADWPAPGELVELPEEEAADYLAAGFIAPGGDPETATTPKKPETATTRRPRGSAKKRAAAADAKNEEPQGDGGPKGEEPQGEEPQGDGGPKGEGQETGA